MINHAENIEFEPLSKSRLRLWLKLLKTSGLIEEELRRRMRNELGTTLPRFDVMSALSRSPDGLKMSNISKRLRVSNGNITGIVDKLTDEGLALRVSCPGDRRTQFVRLTSKGKKVFDNYAKQHEAWIEEILKDLDSNDLILAIKQLDILQKTAEGIDKNAN